jgi:hypothetical protein
MLTRRGRDGRISGGLRGRGVNKRAAPATVRDLATEAQAPPMGDRNTSRCEMTNKSCFLSETNR